MESKHFLTTDSTSLGRSCTLIQSKSVTLNWGRFPGLGMCSSCSAALSSTLSIIWLMCRLPVPSLLNVSVDPGTLWPRCAFGAHSTESVDFSSSVSSESFSGVEADFFMCSRWLCLVKHSSRGILAITETAVPSLLTIKAQKFTNDGKD